MSEQAVNMWFEGHQTQIPALGNYHQAAHRMLVRGVASMSEIADVVMMDPGLSITLLRRVNRILTRNRRLPIGSAHTAMGLLGKAAMTRLINGHETLSMSSLGADSRLRQLLSQNYHALAQLDGFVHLQGISVANDMRAAVLLRNVGELSACLFDPARYEEYDERRLNSPGELAHASDVFGFEFHQLGKLLSQQWCMPELLVESFMPEKTVGRKARLIQLASTLSREAERGWYQSSMQDVLQDCADFLDLDKVILCRKIHAIAIQAARTSPIDNVFPAAARLVFVHKVEQPDDTQNLEIEASSNPPKPIRSTAPKRTIIDAAIPEPSFSAQIKRLLSSSEVNHFEVINLLLTRLHKSAQFSHVVLFMLSTDSTTLTTRVGKGVEKNSPFSRLKIDASQSAVFKALMAKPQALLVTPTNYRTYEKRLPDEFKSSCLCQNFVMMSVFSGVKPVGLIYCDRSATGEDINKSAYDEFKSTVTIANKALTYLTKHKAAH